MQRSDWISRIEKGDIIRSRDGVLRVVRHVSHWVNSHSGQRRTNVFLAIRKPSWTRRPYTVYGDNDLRQMGYRPTGKKWPLDSEFDRNLERSFGSTPCTASVYDYLGVA